MQYKGAIVTMETVRSGNIRKESRIVDSVIISLIILIPLLIVTHHLLGAYFDLIYRYNYLAELYFDEAGVDKSMSEVFWFGFNMIEFADQMIMLDTILYIIFFSFFVLGVLVYIYYIKPRRSDK